MKLLTSESMASASTDTMMSEQNISATSSVTDLLHHTSL
jgi:hypothetical protein